MTTDRDNAIAAAADAITAMPGFGFVTIPADELAAVAVSAAWPHIAAQTLKQAADDIYYDGRADLRSQLWHIRNSGADTWLDARAKAILKDTP